MKTNRDKGGPTEATQITWAQVEEYLHHLAQKGCTKQTIQTYRWNLLVFWNFLHGETLKPDSAEKWKSFMFANGSRVRTINHRISSINGFLTNMHLWDYRAQPLPVKEAGQPPELTRTEYMQLLLAARFQKKEQTYLLVKLFACTGIRIQDLASITKKAAREGKVCLENKTMLLPQCLCEELLAFADKKSLREGPIFVTRTGRLLSRSNVTASIERLSEPAGVAREKCNPRCLRKLYQDTHRSIEENASFLIEQAYTQLINQEQLTVGWTSAPSNSPSSLHVANQK